MNSSATHSKKKSQKDAKKECTEKKCSDGRNSNSDKKISQAFKKAQDDISKHIDADLDFAKDLEETSAKVNRMMLRIAEKKL